ncbi:unnamed protein product [Ilex paraguariensis]|uniref:U-box domain-containing protein n=2 Tax=Ilex paraguariensis TaxID=185542 RepID=A0ABC8UJC1_9AQUA
MDNIEVPEYFICPISLQIMKDPVTAITGITYDRECIEHWLFEFEGENMICPVTKQALPKDSDLTPNHTLLRLIQAWCITNASMGIDRIPTPKPPLNKFHVLNLVKGLWVPKLQLKTLKKLEVLAMENERNMKYMVEAGVVKAMVTFIIACYKKKETTGLEEALSILHLLRSVEKKIVQDENCQIIDALKWVLECDWDNKVTVKNHAVLLLKTITGKADSGVLERLKVEFFERIIQVLREGISQQGIKAALQVLLDACPWGRNRIMMVETGAVFQLIELELGSPENRTTELILGVLFHLCSCADGRAQLLSHAGGIAVITKRILNVSPAADDRAMMIISLICKFSGTSWVLQEMLRVGTITKLCMVLQVDCASYLKDKAREILRTHSNVWKNSPCVDAPVLTRYSSS